MKQNNLKLALRIFWFFFRIGFFTFGGGWSILMQMEREFVERRQLLKKEELLDIASVGRSLPGIMIANICVIFGYRMGGVLCALAAVLGITLPALLILSFVTIFYSAFRDNIHVARALTGVRAAVVPIIAVSMVSLAKSAFKDKICWIIALAAFALSLFTPMSNVLIVCLGVVCGLILMEVKHRAAG